MPLWLSLQLLPWLLLALVDMVCSTSCVLLEPLVVLQTTEFARIGFQIDVPAQHAIAPVIPDPEVTDGCLGAVTAADDDLFIPLRKRAVHARDQRPPIDRYCGLCL